MLRPSPFPDARFEAYPPAALCVAEFALDRPLLWRLMGKMRPKTADGHRYERLS